MLPLYVRNSPKGMSGSSSLPAVLKTLLCCLLSKRQADRRPSVPEARLCGPITEKPSVCVTELKLRALCSRDGVTCSLFIFFLHTRIVPYQKCFDPKNRYRLRSDTLLWFWPSHVFFWMAALSATKTLVLDYLRYWLI